MKEPQSIMRIIFTVLFLCLPVHLLAQGADVHDPLPQRIGAGTHTAKLNSIANLLTVSLRHHASADVLRYKSVTFVEYWNGSGWVDWQTEDWKHILDGSNTGSWIVTEPQATFRFTINLGGDWSRASAFFVGQDYAGGEVPYNLTIESSGDQTNWTTRLSSVSSDNSPAQNIFLSNETGQHRYVRFTFETGASGTNHFRLYQLSGFNRRAQRLSDNATLPFVVTWDKKIGFGTSDPTHKLTVAGAIRAEEVIVSEDIGADFVFNEDYPLMTLEELNAFISANRHLPDIPPASQMIEQGVNVGELQIKLLQKIEELSLYAIEQEKKLSTEKKINRTQSEIIQELLQRIKQLELEK